MQDTVTAKDIARALGISERAVQARAPKESWAFEDHKGRGRGGKRRLYPLASLPADVRQAIASAMLAGVPAPAVPAVPTKTVSPLASLTKHQRETALARLAFVREIDRLAVVVRKEKAIRQLVDAARDGSLPPRLAGLVAVANDRMADGRGLSRRRLYGWCSLFAEGGEAALAPRHKAKDMTVPAWAPAFLAIWQQPQKPTIADAYNQLVDAYEGVPPSIFAVRRFLAKMADTDREAGRDTGNALLKRRPHKRRSTDELWPTDVYTADGTTFDAEIQHPVHGQPFKPEVTFVIDVATRRCVGLSIGEAESAGTVLDALRMACLFGGIPALFYTDNGPGYVNNIMLTPGSGMLDRLGIDAVKSIPGRPQGKGLMERAVQTLCDPLSRRLPSCSHADMDGDAAKKVFKITRADVKKHGKSKLLPTWETFKAALLARVEEYNAAPHRGLARIEDQSTGRRRHLSPNEAWKGFVARGFEPFSVPEAIRDELFMPGIPRKVRNGEVRLFNNTYFADALADFHGDFVDVRYDIWDASTVYCWTTRGEMICTARLDANTIDYFPKSQVEAAREKRAKGQLSRLAGKIDRIAPGATVQLPEVSPVLTLMADGVTPDLPEALPVDAASLVPAKRPLFLAEQDRYAWLMRNRDRWTEGDHGWMDAYVRSPGYADLHDYYRYEGIAWDGNVLARAQTE
ncbi:Mu transposase C-terminal domain-containing protein [Desulfovibrio sp. DV]|uniref:Mu transposase C-terminal domain-containing protein n=1 Tax=Desulfovibrio sp. DV TaxID=1844708 RepID=UPI00094BBC64|nr:Mu transposase C-terminal domain-containing protein [Desulfovibrio sp. DV]